MDLKKAILFRINKIKVRFTKESANAAGAISHGVKEGIDNSFDTKSQSNQGFKFILSQAQANAGKGMFFGFFALFYGFLILGAIRETDLLSFTIDFSIFTSITIISIYTFWFSRRNAQKNAETQEKHDKDINLMQSDLNAMNKKYNDTVDILVKENVRQINYFGDLMHHLEDEAEFGTLIYSVTDSCITSVNKCFRNMFGFSIIEMNAQLLELTERESIFKIIDILSYEHDVQYNRAKIFSILEDKEDKFTTELYLYCISPKGYKTASPFRVSLYYLPNAPTKSFQIIFIDLTLKKTTENLLQMHYQTIIEFTKESLRNKLTEDETNKLILAMHEYSKRIKISEQE